MSTVADYIGRTLDVSVFRGAKAAGVAKLSPALLANGGEVCTGTQKLAQRWAMEFLTEKGSMPLLPNRGCRFMLSARQGRLRTEADVFTEFLLSKPDLETNLAGEDQATDSADERYADCFLTSVAIRPDRTLALTVAVVSVAGTSRPVILPIAVTPGRPLA